VRNGFASLLPRDADQDAGARETRRERTPTAWSPWGTASLLYADPPDPDGLGDHHGSVNPRRVGYQRPHDVHNEPYHAYTVAEMRALPRPPWLVEGVIRRGHLGMMFGQASSGKTPVALDLALSVATGRSCIDAWLKTHGYADADLDGWFFVEWRAAQIKHVAERQEFVNYYRDIDFVPDLVVLDNFGCLSDDVDDTKSGRNVGPWCKGAKALGRAFGDAAVVFLHHTPKNDDDEFSGSNAFRNHVEISLLVKKKGEDVEVRLKKNKFGKDDQLLARLKLQTVPLPPESWDEPSVVFVPADEAAALAPGTQTATDARALTKKQAADDADVLRALLVRDFPAGELERYALDHDRVSRKRFYNALKRLSDSGRIINDNGVYRITSAGRAWLDHHGRS
jgi:hypothetical protein